MRHSCGTNREQLSGFEVGLPFDSVIRLYWDAMPQTYLEKTMSEEMKAFLLELADLLERHDGQLWATNEGEITAELAQDSEYIPGILTCGNLRQFAAK